MQLKYHMVTIEDLVPENHFLRRLEAVLNLTFVYEETAAGSMAVRPLTLWS